MKMFLVKLEAWIEYQCYWRWLSAKTKLDMLKKAGLY